jgi:hypothetical protein
MTGGVVILTEHSTGAAPRTPDLGEDRTWVGGERFEQILDPAVRPAEVQLISRRPACPVDWHHAYVHQRRWSGKPDADV